MKRLLFCLGAILLASVSRAQISLEHTYPGWTSGYMQTSEVEGEGSKFIWVNTATQQIELYNANHSLWKSIPTSLPAGTTIWNTYFASKYLFNADAKVEVVVYTYNATGPVHTIMVISEDGTVLLSATNGNGVTVKKMDGNWKLIVHCSPSAPVLPYTEVYGVPGTYFGALGDKATYKEISSAIYPNPVETNAIVNYALPEGEHTGILSVYNSIGQVVKTYTVTDNYRNVIINKEALPAGNYVYRISAGGVSSTGEKFEIR